MTASPTYATRRQSEAIRNRMREIRSELPYDVDDARARVKQLSDWKYYVAKRPLLVAGVAAAVGYLLVPARRAQASTVVVQRDRAGAADAPAQKGLFAGIAGTVATLLIRQAVGMATKQVMGAISARNGVHPSPSRFKVRT